MFRDKENIAPALTLWFNGGHKQIQDNMICIQKYKQGEHNEASLNAISIEMLLRRSEIYIKSLSMGERYSRQRD